MPPMVTKKRSGENSPPPVARAMEHARHVAGDRLAQLGDAALVGIESLAAVERSLGGLDDERRRWPVIAEAIAGSAPADRGRS